MASTIANAGLKEGLSLQEIEAKVLAYQQLKLKKARSMALASVDSFAERNNLTIPVRMCYKNPRRVMMKVKM